MHRLAVLTFQTDQSMGELAGRMVERGLIERVEGAGRAVRHRLTAEGQHCYEAGSGIFDQVLFESLGALTADERATLRALLAKAEGA